MFEVGSSLDISVRLGNRCCGPLFEGKCLTEQGCPATWRKEHHPYSSSRPEREEFEFSDLLRLKGLEHSYPSSWSELSTVQMLNAWTESEQEKA